MLGIGAVQLPCSGECVRMWGGVHEGSGWGLCGLFGESSIIISLTFVSWRLLDSRFWTDRGIYLERVEAHWDRRSE